MATFETEQFGDVTVVKVIGDVDTDGATKLRIILVNCLLKNDGKIVVDLSQMRFIGYLGVNVLVDRLEQLRLCNSDMVLIGANLHTQRLFKKVGADSLFRLYPLGEKEAAIASFG